MCQQSFKFGNFKIFERQNVSVHCLLIFVLFRIKIVADILTSHIFEKRKGFSPLSFSVSKKKIIFNVLLFLICPCIAKKKKERKKKKKKKL